ncbi:hypothetical protein LIG30_3940 [Burkholderia sp. lig30]|jgi:hypothetical protein|nr:hypothetical protein LIG30_3940 [Burkholderia sp. lig30]
MTGDERPEVSFFGGMGEGFREIVRRNIAIV